MDEYYSIEYYSITALIIYIIIFLYNIYIYIKYIYIFVTKALKRCSNGKTFKTVLVGHGLFVHKMVGVVHLKVSLSSATMEVEAYRIAGGNLNSELLM